MVLPVLVRNVAVEVITFQRSALKKSVLFGRLSLSSL